MSKRWDLELITGVFLLAGLLALGYLSIRLARMEIVGPGGYTVYAVFSSVQGLNTGAVVEVAGVEVGRVRSITLENYRAHVGLSIRKGLKLPEDTIVSIRTKGLLGEKFVSLSPGGSEQYLASGDKLTETQEPVDLEELISNFIFGKI